jgi:lysophospholipase L1-like esterase
MGSCNKIRVLCFGDSLTAGYSQYGTVFHPYCEILESLLQRAFPGETISVVENGMSGDMVSVGNFQTRLNHQRKSKSQSL